MMAYFDIIVGITSAIAASTGSGAIAWLFKLSPRIAVLETKQLGLEELINRRFDAMEKFNDHRFGRLEQAMNGTMRHVGN